MGSGTLTLSGANTYSGVTVVSNGTLLINGSLGGAGAVTVTSGTLGGAGTIAGPVTIQPSAALAPGASVGTLTLQNNLTLAGDLLLEVDKASNPSNDLVQVSGQLTNAGNGTVFIANLGSAYAAGDSFKFFNKALLNGGALNISPAHPAPGLTWTNKLASDGSIGVITAPDVGTPADLVGLSIHPGALTPAFASDQFSYAVSFAYSNSTVTLTPTAANPAATIRIIAGGVTNLIASGATSGPMALKVNTNLITIRVTAPDESVTKEYEVAVHRIPPHVLLVLADDVGFSDWGSYGSEIATPHLDQLATNGLRFRQFYNAARCSPTRCSILTGLYTHQVAVDPAQALPNLRTDNNVTIAELLRANGYRTYLSGKWHLGTSAGRNPWQRGFDHFWGFPNGHSADNWRTNQYTLVSLSNEVPARVYPPGTFHQSDAIGDYSVDFLNHHFAKVDQKPFFLHMTFGAAHFPLQIHKPLVDAYTPVYAAGWDVIRAARYSNMLAQGVIDARYLLSPRGGTAPHGSEPIEEIPAWNTLSANRQADLARRMAIYAGMVENLDANVGRVVNLLRQQGQLENTLIIALSDNGGNHEGGRFGQTGGTINATPLTGPALDNMGQDGQPIIYLGGGWANVNNTPLRLFKHSTHGGGVRTPMIIHWPQGLTRTNQWDEQPGHLMDIMATIADVTGADYPTQFNGHPVLPLEGISLKPLFTTQTNIPRTMGFEHESNRAWIDGQWKFVTKNFTLYDGSSPAHELELYNLSTDPVELTNLAYAQPQLLAQLATNWNAWAARVGVPSGRWLTTFTNTPPPVIVTPAPTPSDLFLDTFNRANATDADAFAAGMSGSRVPPLGAGATYYEGFEGSGAASSIQVMSGTLQMAVGAGMSENGLQHNFIGADIISAGGFSVELNIQSITTDISDAANRYAGFGVGLSQAEAATGADLNNAPAPGAVAFRGSPTGNPGVADFFVELDLNGNVKVWRNGSLLDTVSVGVNYGLLTACFELAGFSTSDVVTVKVFFNGQPVDINTPNANSISRTFTWDRNDSNYIGLSARASSQVQLDNLVIRKLPVATGLIINYAMRHGLTGAATAPESDADADGVNTFGEWAFGGDPAAADAALAQLKALAVSGDFRFEFQRLQNAALYGLQFRYFVSENLTTWTETAPVLVTADSNEDRPGYEVVTLQLPPATTTGKTNLFVRVRAEPLN